MVGMCEGERERSDRRINSLLDEVARLKSVIACLKVYTGRDEPAISELELSADEAKLATGLRFFSALKW